MVKMTLHVLILLCVVNICSTHSLPQGCSENLHHLCYYNDRCVFENSLTCNYNCPAHWLPNFEGFNGRRYKRAVPLERKVPPTQENETEVSDTYLHLHLNPE